MYISLVIFLQTNSKINSSSLPKMKRMTRNTKKSKLQLDLNDFKSILKKELQSMTSNLLQDLNIGSQSRVLDGIISENLEDGYPISTLNDLSDEGIYCIQNV
jgi:hypothetical protein